MSDSVEVFLNGGVGNQLFGWATAQTLATKLGVPLTLNISNLSQRGFQLGDLDLKNSTVSREKAVVYRIHNPVVKSLYRRVFLHDDFFEKSFKFDDRIESIKQPVRLHGYFQSYKYFFNSQKEIKELILNPKTVSKTYSDFESSIDFGNSLAIHLRRGDYLNNISFHGIVGESYYKNALRHCRDQFGDKKIFVFTDDRDEAYRIFPSAHRVITKSEIPMPLENVILMSKFSGLVGANSSFSYWAGILSESAIRIFPKKWFADETVDIRDLAPEDFLKM